MDLFATAAELVGGNVFDELEGANGGVEVVVWSINYYSKDKMS
jgi:hypothetical protein